MLQPPGGARRTPQASARRKTPEAENPDDVIRQLQRLPANKKCADCSSKLPACVNLTVGSFVCMTCAGIHRELTQARIKGVGHSSFTVEEAAKMKATDNDQVNLLWLARYNPTVERIKPPIDNSDNHQLKSWIRRKYYDKAWYSGGGPDGSQSTSTSTPSRHQQQRGQQPQATVVQIPPAAPAVDLFGGFTDPAPAPPAAASNNTNNQGGWDAFGGSSQQQQQPPPPLQQQQQQQQQQPFQANFANFSAQPPAVAAAFPADFGSSQNQAGQNVFPPSSTQQASSQAFPADFGSSQLQQQQQQIHHQHQQQAPQQQQPQANMSQANFPQQPQQMQQQPQIQQQQQQPQLQQQQPPNGGGAGFANFGQQQMQPQQQQPNGGGGFVANFGQMSVASPPPQQQQQQPFANFGNVTPAVYGQQQHPMTPQQQPHAMATGAAHHVVPVLPSLGNLHHSPVPHTVSTAPKTAADAISAISIDHDAGGASKPTATAGTKAKYKTGQSLYYKSTSFMGKAEIVSVHFDDELDPFYTVKVNGKEKQTDEAHLSLHSPMLEQVHQMLESLDDAQLQQVQQFVSRLALMSSHPQQQQPPPLVSATPANTPSQQQQHAAPTTHPPNNNMSNGLMAGGCHVGQTPTKAAAPLPSPLPSPVPNHPPAAQQQHQQAPLPVAQQPQHTGGLQPPYQQFPHQQGQQVPPTNQGQMPAPPNNRGGQQMQIQQQQTQMPPYNQGQMPMQQQHPQQQQYPPAQAQMQQQPPQQTGQPPSANGQHMQYPPQQQQPPLQHEEPKPASMQMAPAPQGGGGQQFQSNFGGGGGGFDGIPSPPSQMPQQALVPPGSIPGPPLVQPSPQMQQQQPPQMHMQRPPQMQQQNQQMQMQQPQFPMQAQMQNPNQQQQMAQQQQQLAQQSAANIPTSPKGNPFDFY